MKKALIIRIVLWSVFAVVLSGILVSALTVPTKNLDDNSIFGINLSDISIQFGSTSYANYENEENYAIGESVFAGELEDIDINWISGNVFVIPYEKNMVTIKENCVDELTPDFRLRHNIENGKLTIQPCKSGKFSAEKKLPDKDLYLYLPFELAKKLDNLQIETVSANVNITNNSDIKTSSMDITTVSGEIWLLKVFANELTIETTSGYVNLTEVIANSINTANVSGNTEIMASTSELKAEAVSGKVYLSTTHIPEKTYIETVSGKVDIFIPENDGFSLNFETVSGNLDCEFSPLMGEKGQKKYKNGEKTLNIETVSGKLNIAEGNF